MRFLLRLVVTAASVWVAVELVPGIGYAGSWPGLLFVALLFGAVNAVIRPVLALLTCPLIFLTLGLFVFVLNGLMLLLTARLAVVFGVPFAVEGLVPGILGALVIGITSAVLNTLVGDPGEEKEG